MEKNVQGPETNSSHLKMDAWKTKPFLLGRLGVFEGLHLAVIFQGKEDDCCWYVDQVF